ncbi:MAG: hypothetical protein KF893_20855 [Caldilineaceae bacterium]|nr:hypothetical protein [Caldilineaceae bacterium]
MTLVVLRQINWLSRSAPDAVHDEHQVASAPIEAARLGQMGKRRYR